MRLTELINFKPQPSKQNKDSYLGKLAGMDNTTKLGVGSFGTALSTSSGKRLNQVTKVGNAATFNDGAGQKHAKKVSQDGYLSYLKAIVDSKSNNPYFPRIHDLKILKDKDGKLSYRANIEKLLPFDTYKITENEDLMASLYDDMFTDRDDVYASYGPAHAIRSMLDKESVYARTSKVKDPELKEALELIYAVQKKGKFMSDIHRGNIMWRITGTRPQLVIVDPLA